MAAATYIDENKKFRTFPLKNIEKHGCCRSLASRLHYARKMIDQIQESEKKGKKEWDLFFNTSRFNFWQRLSISPMCFGMIDSFIVKLFICGVIIEMLQYFRLGRLSTFDFFLFEDSLPCLRFVLQSILPKFFKLIFIFQDKIVHSRNPFYNSVFQAFHRQLDISVTCI